MIDLRPGIPRKAVWFVILTFGLAWAIMVPASLHHLHLIHLRVPGGLQIATQFTPALAAFIVAAGEGWASVKKLLGGIVRVRVPLRWYAFALILPVAMMLAELGGYDLLARPFATTGHWYDWPMLVLIFTPLCLGEEIGWRGMFLERLLDRRSLVGAAVIMALIWGLWHLPFYLAANDLQTYGLFMLGVFPACALFTLLYVETRSILLCAMLHSSLNVGAPFWLANVPPEHIFCAWALFVGMTWVAGAPTFFLLLKRDKKALHAAALPATGLVPV